MPSRIAQALAVLSTGLLAGAFAYALVSVVPTFDAVPLDVHLQYRTALMYMNGIFMQALMAVSLLSSFWLAITLRVAARWYAVAAGVLALTSLLVTRFGNVPINGKIKTWSSSLPPDHAEILQRWEVYHDIRTATAVAAFVLLIVLVDKTRRVTAASAR
ncbi:anthrone oxygenase family protein [Micromonospora sp. NPDC047670]|uniref:anthrone oxygenase family protein n=1 Tax=Micromonospora sp. NPDC047670 TaxID=3364252 RepID=UPI003718290F